MKKVTRREMLRVGLGGPFSLTVFGGQPRYWEPTYSSPSLSQDEQNAVYAAYGAINGTPGVSPGLELAPPEAATTVRVQDGKTLTTDGPFVATKEALGGWLFYEADDLDAAIDLASRIPAASMGGAVEVPGHLLLSAGDDDVEPITDEDLADEAAIKLSEARSGIAEFRRMGMLTIDDELDCYVVKNWGSRQFETDDVAIRTRKHRAERNGSHRVAASLERRWNVPTVFLRCSRERRWNGPREQRAENRKQRYLKPVFRVTQEAVHRPIGVVA